MQTLIIALGALVGYIVAYHTYGRWLGQKIFQLDAKNRAPSHVYEDGEDFVPTSKGVVFGHHFTSIAGTGPIVGPALAVIWGWVPALLWVLFGSVFIGALHDFAALVVSMRNKGQTLGDISGRVLSQRTRILFLSVLFMALSIVLAIFGLVIANVFQMFPAAIFPCIVQTPIAVLIGLLLHKKKLDLLLPSLLALGLMYLSVIFGDWGFLAAFNATLAAGPVFAWVVLLLVYSYIASVLPVWILLQPRDFINALQLLSALSLVVIGLVAAALFGFESGGEKQSLEIVAPAFRVGADAPVGAPWIFPFLFVTIACGAVSGFHCLVSSGTSSKQLRCEKDALFVGYGSMLTEGFLAVLVILACVAGIGLGVPEMVGGKASDGTLRGVDAYQANYAEWESASKGAISAFVSGSGNFIQALGIGAGFATALMGVFVASFAATTMDSACRLQRYVIQELGEAMKLKPLQNKHIATIFAIILAGVIAAMPPEGSSWTWGNLGKGGLLLWPLFGATNQLLGGLAFIVILFWMRRRNMPIWFVVIPTIFMLVLPASAMIFQLIQGDAAWLTGKNPNYLLSVFGIITLAVEVWIVIEALFAWPKAKGAIEELS